MSFILNFLRLLFITVPRRPRVISPFSRPQQPLRASSAFAALFTHACVNTYLLFLVFDEIRLLVFLCLICVSLTSSFSVDFSLISTRHSNYII